MKRQLTTDEIQQIIAQLENYLNDLKSRWDQDNSQKKSYWKVNFEIIIKGCQFILAATDELILFVNQSILANSDKKAAVMSVSGNLFDYIITQSFPFWLKPFAPTIKSIIINIVVSNMIDFIVSKYKAGFWNLEQQQNGEANKT